MRVSDTDIAIAGLGLRLPPDINDADQFWEVLTSGRSVSGLTSSGPDGRRTPADGDGATGGLRRGIDEFDPLPFGIGMAEATDIDPQQRLVLESTWDCLADAGIGWNGLRGRSVGVFAGAYAQDWLLTQARSGAPFSGYVGTGTAHSMLANRLSYLLDVHGPSLAIDTACSSSLTALHLAIGALQREECELAVVTAVALGFDPTYRSMTTSALPFSPRGMCRPFDAAADGIIRGEGAVTLLLELDRTRGNRRSRATLLGSAVNHDGRTNGLTAPSTAAQTRLLRTALADAGVRASDVGYLEAHGTGTVLGDPIEARAIAAVYCADEVDRDAPLLIGSVKGALGHLEAAAGLAGVAVAVLSLQHREVPAQPGFAQINPAIDLRAGSLAVPQQRQPLQPGQLVAVSSFGFGGSNAHVVLGPAGPQEIGATEHEDDPAALHVLTLSAADADSLRARRELARQRLAAADAEHDVVRRTTRADAAHRYRFAWSAGSDADLACAVQEQAGGRGTGRISPASRAGAVWVFSGQGSRWSGMAAELLRVPRLRASWQRWEHEVHRATGWSLTEVLTRDESGPERSSSTTEDQVTIAAVQLALAELLISWGHRPTAVVGHSMGEVTAAVASGALTSAQGFLLLARRGQWIESAAAGGRMLALALPAAEVSTWIDCRTGVDIAAVNGPRSTVVSGPAESIATLAEALARAGVPARPLDVGYGFHSRLLDAVLPLDRATEDLGVPGSIPQYSTVTGRSLDLRREPDYWWRNVREPVRFADALTTALAETGARCVVELAPRPVLQHDIHAIAEGTLPDESVLVLPATRRGASLSATLGTLASGLYCHGIDLDAAALAPAPRTWTAPVPYGWQRRRFWPETDERRDQGPAADHRPAPPRDVASSVAAMPTPTHDAEVLAAQIRDHICALVSETLDEHPIVSADVPLGDWDLESLAIVTLRNAVEQRFGVSVPLSALFRSPTPRQLAALLVSVDPPETSLAIDPSEPIDPSELADPLDSLTDAELESLLAGLEASSASADTRRPSDPR